MDAVTLGMAKAYAKSIAIDTNNVGDDLIVTIGQSNAAGGSTSPIDLTTLDPTNPRIRAFPTTGTYANQIVLASDPLGHFLTPTNVGPAMPFAREYVKTIPGNRSVLIVPAARGGSSLTYADADGFTWNPADTTAPYNLFRMACAQVDAALAASGPNARIAAFLWVQGESDAGNSVSKATYIQVLDALIAALRAKYGATIPFVLGQMVPTWVAGQAARGLINAAHLETPIRLPYTGFSYGATGAGTVQADAIHYTAAANRINGRRMFDAYRIARGNVLGSQPVKPGLVTVKQSGSSVLVSTVAMPGRITDYAVQAKIGAGAWSTYAHAQTLDPTFTIPGFTLGQNAQVRVASVNEQGTSAYSESAVLPMLNLPAQVTGLTAGASTVAAQTISWPAVAGAADYLVSYRRTGTTGAWSTLVTTSLTAILTGLSANTSYDFFVQGRNAAGTGTASSTVAATTQSFTPLLSTQAVNVTSDGAYSTRKVRLAHAGPCMKVRRTSDNVQLDIGFLPSGDLDTDTLIPWVGSGDAYVTVWYDQSGRGFDITQTNTVYQPKIVTAGVLETLNGKAAPLFNPVAQTRLYLDNASSAAAWNSSAGFSLLAVAEVTSYTSNQQYYMEAGTGTGRYIPGLSQPNNTQREWHIRDQSGVSHTSGARTFAAGNHQHSAVEGGGSANFWEDGAAKTPAFTVAAKSAAFTPAQRNIGGGAFYYQGHVAEIVVFYAQLTDAQRVLGEANQRGSYSTP